MMAETESSQLQDIIAKAKAALEVENSLWVTERMPGFGKPSKRYVRGKNKGRLKFQGPVPTIIVKQEDVARLQQWQAKYDIPIYIVHIWLLWRFARGLSLNRSLDAQSECHSRTHQRHLVVSSSAPNCRTAELLKGYHPVQTTRVAIISPARHGVVPYRHIAAFRDWDSLRSEQWS